MFKYLIIGLVVIVLIVILSIMKNIIMNKNILELLKKNEEKYKLIVCKKKAFDYILSTQEMDYYIKVVNIPKYSQITINSKETWKLSWNSFKTEKGSKYNNDRYLTELEVFLSRNVKTERKYMKIIFLYKGAESIVRYLNESELDVIDIKKSPYGYKITSYNHFEEDLSNILE